MEADMTGCASCVEKSKVLLTKPERKKLFQNPNRRWEDDIKRLLRLTVGVWIWVHGAQNWVLGNSAMSWCVRGKAGKVWRFEQLSVSEEGFYCLCRLAFNKGGRLRTLMWKYAWFMFICMFLKHIGLVRSCRFRIVTIYMESHVLNYEKTQRSLTT